MGRVDAVGRTQSQVYGLGYLLLKRGLFLFFNGQPSLGESGHVKSHIAHIPVSDRCCIGMGRRSQARVRCK